MTHRTMRPLFLLPALAALGLLLPSAVFAQAYSNITRVDVREPGGEWAQKKVATPVYVNADECRGVFRFKLAPIASTVSVMEAWVSSGTGTSCVTAASRSRINNNDPSCWRADSRSGVSGEYLYEIEGKNIFDKKRERCPTDAIDQIFTIFFVPLASSSDNAGSMAPEALFNVIKPQAQFTLYTQRPSPPEGLKGNNGNLALSFSWDRRDNNIRTRYRAFFDYGKAEGRECGGGRLDSENPATLVDAGTPPADAGMSPVMDDAGSDIDASAVDASTADAGASTSSEVKPPEAGYPNIKIIDDIKGTSARWGDIESVLQVGDTVQVAVATIDATGNIGPLSQRLCLKRDNSEDFFARCMRDEKNCRLGDCSAAPGGTGSAFALSTSALALCALLRRRRRSA